MSRSNISDASRGGNFAQFESLAFLDEYSKDALVDTSANDFAYNPIAFDSRSRPSTTGQHSQSKPASKPAWDPLLFFLSNNAAHLIALLPMFSAIFETIMLSYFLVAYLSLPRDQFTNALPRLSDVYAGWPFISCIGAHHMAFYLSFQSLVVFLSIAGSVLTFWRLHDLLVGWQARRAGLLASIVAAVLAIWLILASADVDSHAHLFVTSAKSVAILAMKSVGLFVDFLERANYPLLQKDAIAVLSKRWKFVVIFFALPTAILTNISIYACPAQTRSEMQIPGSTCYKIVSFGAPAEWFYALTTISWSFSIAYDNWYRPHINGIISQHQKVSDIQMQTSAAEEPRDDEILDKGNQTGLRSTHGWKLRGARGRGNYEVLDNETLWEADESSTAVEACPRSWLAKRNQMMLLNLIAS